MYVFIKSNKGHARSTQLHFILHITITMCMIITNIRHTHYPLLITYCTSRRTYTKSRKDTEKTNTSPRKDDTQNHELHPHTRPAAYIHHKPERNTEDQHSPTQG